MKKTRRISAWAAIAVLVVVLLPLARTVSTEWTVAFVGGNLQSFNARNELGAFALPEPWKPKVGNAADRLDWLIFHAKGEIPISVDEGAELAIPVRPPVKGGTAYVPSKLEVYVTSGARLGSWHVLLYVNPSLPGGQKCYEVDAYEERKGSADGDFRANLVWFSGESVRCKKDSDSDFEPITVNSSDVKSYRLVVNYAGGLVEKVLGTKFDVWVKYDLGD